MLKVGDYVKVKDQEFCEKVGNWNKTMSQYCGKVFKIVRIDNHWRHPEYCLEGCTYISPNGRRINGHGYWNFRESTLIPWGVEKLKEFIKNERN